MNKQLTLKFQSSVLLGMLKENWMCMYILKNSVFNKKG